MYKLTRAIKVNNHLLFNTSIWVPCSRGAEEITLSTLPDSEQVLLSESRIMYWNQQGILPKQQTTVITETTPNNPPPPPQTALFLDACLDLDKPLTRISDPKVVELALSLLGKSDFDTVENVADYLTKYISYEYPPQSRDVDQVLTKYSSDCGGYHSAFVGILRKLGIAAVLDFGARLPDFSPHTWAWWWSREEERWRMTDLNDLQRNLAPSQRVSFSLDTGLDLDFFPRQVQFIQNFLVWDWHYRLHQNSLVTIPVTVEMSMEANLL